jgi:hypothetical protein
VLVDLAKMARIEERFAHGRGEMGYSVEGLKLRRMRVWNESRKHRNAVQP